MKKAFVGMPVQYWPDPENDADVMTNANGGPIAGIVVRVWSANVCNIMVFPDCGKPVTKTSVLPYPEVADGTNIKRTWTSAIT